ncbi:MAG: hypothetical protein KAT06_07940 [Gammaproteobacteria bacterium]|nr:hypothetical protein [Gammaproteobacteria bacterium]
MPSEEVTKKLKQLSIHNIKQENNGPDLNLQRLWPCCDRSFAFYDAIVEQGINEEVMLTAQN